METVEIRVPVSKELLENGNAEATADAVAEAARSMALKLVT